jgi:hypothetical protein
VSIQDEAFAELLELVAEGWSLSKIAGLHGLRKPGALWPWRGSISRARRSIWTRSWIGRSRAAAAPARAASTRTIVRSGRMRRRRELREFDMAGV